MTKQQALIYSADWIKKFAVWIVMPSLSLNIFFLTDTYRIIQSIPEHEKQHDSTHLVINAKMEDLIKVDMKFKDQLVELKNVDVKHENKLIKIYYKLKLEPEYGIVSP